MNILQITKDDSGKHKIGKLITVASFLTLSFGFYKEALTNGLVYQDYIAYAVSSTICYAPAKAIDLINAIKGNSTTFEKSSSKETTITN